MSNLTRSSGAAQTAIASQPMLGSTKNRAAPWVDFSSDGYFAKNYASILPEDKEIIDRVGAFFAEAFRGRDPVQRAIDVGSGTNLYPALLMLPWAQRILLTDYTESNVHWLRDCVEDDRGRWAWAPFWKEMSGRTGYDQIGEPRKALREACRSEPGQPGIQQRSIFKLPRQRWQLGTMFFVAESITTKPREFREAVRCFVGALEPGAPFAAAFMADSRMYDVDGVAFPSTPVKLNDVTTCLDALATDLSVEPTAAPPGVRDGYDGMIVATGFARG